jgi:predicted transcriptional regulator
MTFRAPTLRSLMERASNDPQRMRARKTEAKIMEKMPANAWLSCTAVSRLIDAADERKIRARLDRLVRDGKIEREREERGHGLVCLYRRPGTSTPVVQEAAQLRALISELRQTIRNFAISIETEKARARDIKARRDNLLATISSLENYLNDLGC